MPPRSRPNSVADKSDYRDFPQGFRYLPGFLDEAAQLGLAARIETVVAAAPLYRPHMPRTGKPFSIEMTNCGALGWVSDREGGYRYQSAHPITGAPWPPLPPELLSVWSKVTGHAAPPEACLVNHYLAGAKLGSHADRDEQDFSAPVVSVSLGDTAVFHIGGTKRTDPKRKIELRSGDVVVLGGVARLAFHGIDRIRPGTSKVVARGGRLNLTLRRVTRP